MTEPFYVGAYWGPRAESIRIVCREAGWMLAASPVVQPAAGKLVREGPTPLGCQATSVEVSPSTLRQLLEEGVNRRDSDGGAIGELGFSVGLWNGQSKVPIGLHLTCGASTTSPGVMNSFVLDLPVPEGEATELYELGTARRLVEAVAAAWKPDWATLTSHGLHDALNPPPRQPVLGWITYLSRGRPVPSHVGSARVEPYGHGTLMVAADSVEAVNASELQRLAADLENAGSLIPTPRTEAPS